MPARQAAEPRLDGDRQLALLLEIAVLCNDASLDSASAEGSGDPMEVALLRAGLRAGVKRSERCCARCRSCTSRPSTQPPK